MECCLVVGMGYYALIASKRISASFLRVKGCSRARKQANKHLEGIQLEPCPGGVFFSLNCQLFSFLEKVSQKRLELYQLAIKKIETVSVFVDIRTDLQKDQMHRYLFIVAISKIRLMLRVAKVNSRSPVSLVDSSPVDSI